jgi:hypothetical protein
LNPVPDTSVMTPHPFIIFYSIHPSMHPSIPQILLSTRYVPDVNKVSVKKQIKIPILLKFIF